jgi:hypothetical protein
VDNIAPESLYVDDDDLMRLNNLSELRHESILVEWVEMLQSQHAMSKALH